MSEALFEIRPATEADVTVMAGHRVSMFREMGSVNPALEGVLLDAATTHIREAMVGGEYVAWLAHPPGEPRRILGGGGVQLRRLFPRPQEGGQGLLIGREGIVLNMYVERDARRRGVARRIMEEILTWVSGTDVVRLVLHASDEGRPLYELMGFAQTNEMCYTHALR